MGSSAYHHGELPATLMDLAVDHIAEHGTEKLSLRALAREAGVSPTAPYRHFPSKQCLLAAIATQGFETLRAKHAQIVSRDLAVRDKLFAMANAYVSFAIEDPISYQLMFGSVLGDFSEYDMLQRAATASYEEVDLLLQEIIASEGLAVDAVQLGGVMWSFLHGLCSLLINAPNLGRSDAKPMQALTAVQRDPEAALQLMFGDLFPSARDTR